MRIPVRQILSNLAIAIILYLLLSIPDPPVRIIESQESVLSAGLLNDWWPILENDLKQLKKVPHDTLVLQTDLAIAELKVQLSLIKLEPSSPNDRLLKDAQQAIFDLSPRVALFPEKLNDYQQIVFQWKQTIKNMSRFWNLNSNEDKTALYYYLNGSRLALNQAILQSVNLKKNIAEPVLSSDQVEIQGIKLKSGDFIVWNKIGDSPIFAMSKDLPGLYNAVSIVYVPNNGETNLIHIDPYDGVVIQTLQEFRKLDISSGTVLRLRSDLPALVSNPDIPQEAAELAMDLAEKGADFDFAMDDSNHDQLYPMEFLTSIYESQNVSLGIKLSDVSSFSQRERLSKLGVTHYNFIEPSELEYDHQTTIVGYWVNPEQLMREQIQLAATYTALETMDDHSVRDNLTSLPKARFIKIYSSMLNAFGFKGPIPVGMSAQSALAFAHFKENFKRINLMLLSSVDSFEAEYKIKPTYPRLLQLAQIGLK